MEGCCGREAVAKGKEAKEGKDYPGIAVLGPPSPKAIRAKHRPAPIVESGSDENAAPAVLDEIAQAPALQDETAVDFVEIAPEESEVESVDMAEDRESELDENDKVEGSNFAGEMF